MKEIKIKGYGKINLSLDILGRRENGYHDLEMVMESVDLYDDICIQKTNAGIEVRTNHKNLPTDERNLAYRAAQLLMEKFEIKEGVRITIDKNIPMAAGMAGGSADGAAVLTGMNQLFSLKLRKEELQELGLKLGADVPYCIEGGSAHAKGVGEILSPLKKIPACWIGIVKPDFDVSTKWAFETYDKLSEKRHPNTQRLLDAIQEEDLDKIGKSMGNVLEYVTIEEYPVIAEIKSKLMKHGALGAMMTGSGPTVFGIFLSKEKALDALNHIEIGGVEKWVQTLM
ncbi:4-diphosphocytidyl-2-C-methyl-D-erythritol kinase [Aequitasia blattaphilus]|uniref:4-diphosphocytidyl-2-C-methyl-D-erythritol kinase n=1 Tax=Aequitasia blattaphilus TaxID=2949332 RepID=A0ABT1E4W3_9FIRM|nr:4-(cytidine 5'-diphospho)-2-C-methyl-D-erythritol kinase [Aequitasia blattaphilus]MCP1100875.1 4-(cytidine 5'-diphospho)-2-C-methyl-D-erythritol kinase [Aequitasia blattaphilus]MCR8613515.1 4-(cytidine 5'-diphospho)-2-C-methyl-D-erythritol kinase [Aequitasia blattaphilus]